MITEKLTSPDDLRGFTGTENWYKHPFSRRVIYTDGVKHFAQNAGNGAYWFLDILATEVYQIQKKSEDNYFLSIKMNVANGKANIIVTDGNEKLLFTKPIDFTDCPSGLWEFFMIVDDQHSVILLTSEY